MFTLDDKPSVTKGFSLVSYDQADDEEQDEGAQVD